MPAIHGSSVVTEVTSDHAAHVNLLASNRHRSGAMIYNNTNQILLIKLGDECATDSFTIKVAGSGGYFVLPLGEHGVYKGIITAISAAEETGSVMVTEWS